VRSCNHCCSGKAISITYCECMCVSVCICSQGYPAWNAHAQYCHLWPAQLYSIFPHYLISGTIFEKKVMEHKMCILISYTTFVLNMSHSMKKWLKYGWSSCKVPVILVRLMKLEFSGEFFETYSNIKFHENPLSGNRVVPCGQTDRHFATWRKRLKIAQNVMHWCNFYI